MPGPCDLSHYETEWMQGSGARVDVKIHPEFRPTRAQLEAISAAIRAIPAPHLRDFDQRGGYIQIVRPGCSPATGGGHRPGAEPWIRLSHASLGEGYNAMINVTLLHEMGHIVDEQYHAMEALHRSHPDDYELLASTGHRGATGGAGERFADCYMIYLVRTVAHLPYNHPADPRAYQGAAAQQRFDALLRSPAFHFLHAPSVSPRH